MIKSLNSLRFIFAILVFLHHSRINGVRLSEPAGPMAVCFFFVLSGFVLAYGYYEKVLKKEVNYGHFFGKRLAHLYPLHLICLVFFLILNCFWGGGNEQSVIPIISNIFMVQSWIPFEDFYYSGNPVSWCMSSIFLWYMIFPIIVQITHKKPILISAIIIAVYICLLSFLYYLLPEGFHYWFAYVSPISRLADFLVGYLLFLTYRFLKDKFLDKLMFFCRASFYKKTAIEFAILLQFVLLSYLYDSNVHLMLDFLWILPCSVCILYFSLVENDGGVIQKLLYSDILFKAGFLSFTMFLIHVICIFTYRTIFVEFGNVLFEILGLILLCAFILLLSWLINKYVEKPIQGVLTNMIEKIW